MADNNKTLIEELEKRLVWYREEATEEEFDVEDVDAICTMLQKLSPAKEPHRTREEAFQNIMEQIRLEEEAFGKEPARDRKGDAKEPDGNSGEKKRRFRPGKRALRAAIIFLAMVGVLASLNMVTYARENKSLFTLILERVGWLKIVKEPEEEISVIGNDRLAETFYDSWGDLDREVKERLTVPAYIPEGFSLYGVKYWKGENKEIIQSEYYDQGNGHIFVEITLWEDSEDHYRETLMDQDENRLISESSDKNTLYYQYEDEYICLAFRGNGFYRISGNISLDEMIKIGEGLGDIRQK